MNFETLFPGFMMACGKLHTLFMPIALSLVTLSFVFQFWSGPAHPIETLRFLTKLFLIVLLIVNTRPLLDAGQQAVRSFVENNIDARPERVAQRYKERLAEALHAPDLEGKNFLDLLLSANFFEAIICGILTLVSWFAAALLFYIYLFQKMLLVLAWSISPVLFAAWQIPTLSHFAHRHFFRMIGLILWPIALALAATITDGLLQVQTDQNILLLGPVTGTIGYGLQNLLGVAVTALWVIASTILAPLYIQRFITGQAGASGVLPRAAQVLLNTGLPLLQTVVLRGNPPSAPRSSRVDHDPVPTGETKFPPLDPQNSNPEMTEHD